jgi:hypothetical protein
MIDNDVLSEVLSIDVTGDGLPDRIVQADVSTDNKRIGVYIFTSESNFQSSIFLPTEASYNFYRGDPPIVTDLDGDGTLEILADSNNDHTRYKNELTGEYHKNRSSIYAFSTSGSSATTGWSQWRGSPDRHGCVGCAFTPTRAPLSPPGITNQPSDTTVKTPTSAQFTVSASGTSLSYRWQRKAPTVNDQGWEDIPNANTATLLIPTTAGLDGYRYRVVVMNQSRSTISREATLTAVAPDDLCPNDPLKVEPGVCGCGTADQDLNRNEIFDCKEAPITGSRLASPSIKLVSKRLRTVRIRLPISSPEPTELRITYLGPARGRSAPKSIVKRSTSAYPTFTIKGLKAGVWTASYRLLSNSGSGGSQSQSRARKFTIR